MSSPSSSPAAADARPLAEVVRDVYLSRATGSVRVPAADGVPPVLRFRDGELFVLPSGAADVAAALGDGDDGALTEAVRRLARRYPPTAEGVFSPEARLPENVVGPAPAVWLAIELAVHGVEEHGLVARLGGPATRLRVAERPSPALDQLRRLDPEMEQAVALLESRPLVGRLPGASGTARAAVLRGLVKLRAAGLAEAVDDEPGDALVNARVLDRFTQSIAESLAAQPVEVPVDEHRRRVADYLGRLGELDHYELLGVGHGAGDDEVVAAYDRVARLCHPSHAERLGLVGREEGLRVVFERATEAYLVLSHPARRLAYNELIGVHIALVVDRAQRQEEKRDLARRLYRRASSSLAEMDFSTAVDLLGEACRMDPRPEYLALLGRVLAKNPHWRPRAVGALARAVELAPEDAGIRAAYGDVLEKAGRADAAREQYEKAIALAPDQPLARAGLDRLTGGEHKKSGGVRSLFGRR